MGYIVDNIPIKLYNIIIKGEPILQGLRKEMKYQVEIKFKSGTDMKETYYLSKSSIDELLLLIRMLIKDDEFSHRTATYTIQTICPCEGE